MTAGGGVCGRDHPVFLIVVTCLASIVAMINYAIWPVFLIPLGDAWGLSNTEIGWVSGAYFIGYVAATPILVGLTDIIDARRIFIGGSLAAAIGSAGFALFASGFWSAALAWALVGAGLAGTYMPGLQILNARLSEQRRIRAVPFYTSCFSLGTGFSFVLNGTLLAYVDHRVAGWIGAGGALIAAAAVLCLVSARRPTPPRSLPATRSPSPLTYVARKRTSAATSSGSCPSAFDCASPTSTARAPPPSPTRPAPRPSVGGRRSAPPSSWPRRTARASCSARA